MTTAVKPVTARNRILTLDVLRGFALFGILLMNIQFFAMPEAAYAIPAVFGDLTGTNLGAWWFSYLFADQKFMTIFSMLFGAGIIMVTGKLDKRGESSLGLFMRRNFWLLIFGLVHAYLLWAGDILDDATPPAYHYTVVDFAATRVGAQIGMPTRTEIEHLLTQQPT